MLGTREENARLQSIFYKDQFHRLLRLLILSVIIMFILIGVILYLILFKADPNYYANTTNGKILPMPTPIIVKQTS